MLLLAIKMLIGNRAACIGSIFGVFLATLLISQQSAIFLGLVARSHRMVTDIPAPNIWVVDPSTESDEKVRGMPENYLNIVRSLPNIQWASPISVVYAPLVTPSGNFDICHLYIIDDATLIGAPLDILRGDVFDLRREGAVIVDVHSAKSSLAKKLPNGEKVPLDVGDSFEINNRRAVVVGICKITQGFYPQPIIFTTYNNARRFTPLTKNSIAFIAAKSTPGANVQELLDSINSHSTLNGLTTEQLKWRMDKSFLKTGILINFGLTVALGIIIGFSIAGQIFYIMTLHNLTYYALIKALGGNQNLITKMIIIQTLIVSAIGFLLGTGATLIWGEMIKETTLAFLFPWQLLLFTGFIVIIIGLFMASLSLQKVFHTDPKVLMGN